MDISSWKQDEIWVAPFQSRTLEGKPVYGAQKMLMGRVERKQQRVVNTEGVEVPSNTQIATDEAIGPQDRVWFSGADITKTNAARVPVGVDSARNADRTLHLFITFF